jgi:hypothetical protein
MEMGSLPGKNLEAPKETAPLNKRLILTKVLILDGLAIFDFYAIKFLLKESKYI